VLDKDKTDQRIILMNFRCNETEYKNLVLNATELAEGNISKLIRERCCSELKNESNSGEEE